MANDGKRVAQTKYKELQHRRLSLRFCNVSMEKGMI